MRDYSLTDNPAESDMPTEAEPWQPVDVSEVEEKMQNLSTTPVEPKVEAAPSSPPAPQEMEADFGSEPEEVSLKGPLVSTASALPDFYLAWARLYLCCTFCFLGVFRSFTNRVQPKA